MRAFVAFLRKELLECLRSGKLLILGALFLGFGIMNPAVAKMTPWLLELMAEEMAESGMTVTAVTVDALTSWTQFYKNIPMALIAFVLLVGSSFTKEYDADTLILLLTKGLSRTKVLAAKTAVMVGLWSAGYWLCFGVTYLYNDYFWDNSVASALLPAAAL
jgi:ABC-2 type transport system permease protein